MVVFLLLLILIAVALTLAVRSNPRLSGSWSETWKGGRCPIGGEHEIPDSVLRFRKIGGGLFVSGYCEKCDRLAYEKRVDRESQIFAVGRRYLPEATQEEMYWLYTSYMESYTDYDLAKLKGPGLDWVRDYLRKRDHDRRANQEAENKK